MAYRHIEKRRARDLEREHRRTGVRLAARSCARSVSAASGRSYAPATANAWG